ncbi:solute carrier family 25 member 45 isoform X2 [Rhinatrema bivittatum]|uniref:solute carrier family 25 member 45 isoform X2 n=1 Tax=Rhinatrema bivittatum TaxID=194408 RepID=UPI00112B3F02|nr:solute carrier family 25 member 45 isoform X2 [Rhinatrema bivittatum]
MEKRMDFKTPENPSALLETGVVCPDLESSGQILIVPGYDEQTAKTEKLQRLARSHRQGTCLLWSLLQDGFQVRLQTQSAYRGIVDCVVKTYRKETVFGFFKGMSFPVFSVAVSNSVAFGTYSNALLYLRGSEQEDRSCPASKATVYVAGCISGFMQVYVSAPVDLIKVRLQNQTHACWPRHENRGARPRYQGPLHCAAVIFQEEGLRGLFRGSTALLLRDVPSMGVYFLTYHVLCQWMTPEGDQPSSLTVLLAGGWAGTLSWALANPMDVVKARLQMDGVHGIRYQGVWDCILNDARREGPKLFCKGLALNSLRAFPVNAVTFLGYETLMALLR